MTWFGIALLVLLVVVWPVLHGALLGEGVRVLTGRRAELGSLVAAVLLVPLAVAAVELGFGCLTGAVSAFTPLAVGSAALTMAVGLATRAFGYATVLRLPGLGAFGLALGVMLVNAVYGGMLLAIGVGTLWVSGALPPIGQ